MLLVHSFITFLLAGLSFFISIIIVEILRMMFGRISILNNQVVWVFIFFVLLFPSLVYLSIEPTVVEKKVIENIDNIVLKNADCNHICLIVRGKENSYRIKELPVEKVTIIKDSKNYLEEITCTSHSLNNPFNFFKIDTELCKDKGYQEGKNYILHVKDVKKIF